MNLEALRKRYTSLWTGEATASAVFIIILVWYMRRDANWQHWIARMYSVGLIVFILVQGIVWWRWKLWLLKLNQRSIPAHVLQRFRFLRGINWFLIGLYPLVVWLSTRLTQRPLITSDSVWGLIFLGGAILEQINYYYVQLMYDSAYDRAYVRKNRRLRRGNIAKAFDEVN